MTSSITETEQKASKQWRVLTADDHQLFLDGIRMVLEASNDFAVVAEANNGLEVMERLQECEVDAVVLDIGMQEMDGIETAKAIKATYPQIPILMLTMYTHDSYIKRLIRVGVNGYILKENGQRELVTALRELVKGKKYFAPAVTQAVMRSFESNDNESEAQLTKREYEILRLVAQEYTTLEIAEKLFISESTVITHRKNIMLKMNVRNMAGMIKVATERGWFD